MFSEEGFNAYSNDDPIAMVDTACQMLSEGQGMKAIDKLLCFEILIYVFGTEVSQNNTS